MIAADEQIKATGTDVFTFFDLDGNDLIFSLQNEIQFSGVVALPITEIIPICGQLLCYIVFRDSTHEGVPLAGYDLQLRHKLRTMCAGLECPRPRG